MTATYRIVGTLRGTFWWPVSEPWDKPVDVVFTRTRDSIHAGMQAQTLREACERATDDGDSASACHMLADALLVARRVGRTHTTERVFSLAQFPSVAEYCCED